MSYDLLIKGGTVIDGTGMERFSADIGIVEDQIVAIDDNLGTRAKAVVDATDLIVSPGFVDAHTHMDAQIFWDPIGTCSCEHGVTSVVMGNCGFTLAPVNVEDVGLVLENLEEAEAIPADVLAAGVEFRWKTFPEYIETLESLPKGINYAGYVGHSALRTYAMRERAFTDVATPDDLEVMASALKDGLNAGAIGFSTTRNPNHIRPNGEPVVSRLANWSEVDVLVNVMAELDKGIFQISREGKDPLPPDASLDFNTRLTRLAVQSGRPVTLGIFSVVQEPGLWKTLLQMVEDTNAKGGKMIAQVHSNTMYEYHTLRTNLPYLDTLDPWHALKSFSVPEQKRLLSDSARRQELINSAEESSAKPDYGSLMVVDAIQGNDKSVAQISAETAKSPAEVILDHALDSTTDKFFRTPFANQHESEILAQIKHPNSVVTFSDSGAHVSEIADFSLQTHLLSHWVRKRKALTLEEAVRRITSDIANTWGIKDRGALKIGKKADLTIFDADNVAPLMPEVATDLPLNAKRLRQSATGIVATVVNGQIMMYHGEHTGALPGVFLKG